MTDKSVLKHIKDLITEEEVLYAKGGLGEGERHRLEQAKIELDQCWDLLRQRRALRDAGKDPDDARVRSAHVVESYKQ